VGVENLTPAELVTGQISKIGCGADCAIIPGNEYSIGKKIESCLARLREEATHERNLFVGVCV